MPTENRSSNTDMVSVMLPCPFCGQQNFLIERLDSDASVVICQGLTGPHEACLARGPVGVAQDEGEEQPGRDKAVELWNARAEQHQGEPVAWCFKVRVHATGIGLVWREKIEPEAPDTEMVEVRDLLPLYTHVDPGEVERLRNELGEAKGEYDRSANKVADLSAQLDERNAALECMTTTATSYKTDLDELVSAVRSINYGHAHAVQVRGDDEPCYPQRKEWVEWLLGLCDAASAAPSDECEHSYANDLGCPECGQAFDRAAPNGPSLDPKMIGIVHTPPAEYDEP
jgi:hypothetical protein